jgi:hypothetical protein
VSATSTRLAKHIARDTKSSFEWMVCFSMRAKQMGIS